MKVYKDPRDRKMKRGNLKDLSIDFEYKVMSAITDILAIKYALKKLLCSVIEMSKV